MFCCNFFNNNSNNGCCCNLNRCCSIGTTIPNPIIPITPVPTPFVSNALYAIGTAGTVDNSSPVSLTAGAGTPGTTLSVSSTSLNIPAGTYQISFGATGNTSETEAGTFAFQLYANGTSLSTESVSSNGSSTLPSSVAKTLIYSASVPTALSLYNVSGSSVTITNAYITAQKLA